MEVEPTNSGETNNNNNNNSINNTGDNEGGRKRKSAEAEVQPGSTENPLKVNILLLALAIICELFQTYVVFKYR